MKLSITCTNLFYRNLTKSTNKVNIVFNFSCFSLLVFLATKYFATRESTFSLSGPVLACGPNVAFPNLASILT